MKVKTAYDTHTYKVITKKNWMMLHWLINPGLIINELLLGQRIPKVMLEDKTSTKPRFERTYIPCPYCHTYHDSRTWALENGTAFKNWFGLFCPSCQQIIPCLQNVFSWLILVITYPLWGTFKKQLKAKWLAKQPERYQHITTAFKPNPFANKGWIKQGLFFGFFMFIITGIINPWLFGEAITVKSLLIGVPIWVVGGLLYGFIVKKYTAKRAKNASN